MKITIHDIAQKTGLSAATISKFLNHKSVLPENEKKIKEAIEALDYIPSKAAQNLRLKKADTIGIVITNLGNYFWGALIANMTHYLSKFNYSVIVGSYYHDPQKKEELINSLISKNVSGIIMLALDSTEIDYCKFQKFDIPTVIFDQIPDRIDEYPVDCIVSDNYNGSQQLAKCLIDNGHKDIYICAPRLNSYGINQRIKGIVDLYAVNNLPKPQIANQYDLIVANKVSQFGRQCLEKVMKAPDHPSAVVFTTYELAIGGLTAINSCDFKVPDDFSMVSFDDDVLFKCTYPSITAVSQDLHSMAIKSVDLLLRRLHGDYDNFPAMKMIPTIFHERHSVKTIENSHKKRNSQ